MCKTTSSSGIITSTILFAIFCCARANERVLVRACCERIREAGDEERRGREERRTREELRGGEGLRTRGEMRKKQKSWFRRFYALGRGERDHAGEEASASTKRRMRGRGRRGERKGDRERQRLTKRQRGTVRSGKARMAEERRGEERIGAVLLG